MSEFKEPTDHSGELVHIMTEIQNVPLLFGRRLESMLASYNKKDKYIETYESFLRKIQAVEYFQEIKFNGYKISTIKEGRKKRLTANFLIGFPISHLMFPTYPSDRVKITEGKIFSSDGRYVYREFPPEEIDINLTKDKNVVYGYLGEATNTDLLALEYLTRNQDCIGYLDGVGRNTKLYTYLSCTHNEVPDSRRNPQFFDNDWDTYPTLEALDIMASKRLLDRY